MSTAGLGLNAASKSDSGQIENRDYSTEVTHSGYNQDSDSRTTNTTANRDRRDMKSVSFKMS